MCIRDSNYTEATRHPWAGAFFVAPILAAYEGGVIYLSGKDSQALRTGADTWMRWLFDSFGLPALYWPPIVLAAALIVWCYLRRKDKPKDFLGLFVGMTVESLAFALLLFGFGRIHEPLFDKIGLSLFAASSNSSMAQIVSYLGAGIYEELLFRLLLFTAIFWILCKSLIPKNLSLVLAMVLSALAFAAAHHMGSAGETLNTRVFLFRALAGLLFVILYVYRGFGIAVGTHAGYDVMVGLSSS
jgi:membrane protease YdiL (CAAX protease family)